MSRSVNFKESLTEVLTGKSIILLAGGLLLGAITGSSGYSQVEPFFGGLFTGVLTLFLLELGLIAGNRIGDLRKAGVRLVIFGVGFPVIAGTLGITVGLLTGLSVGGATVLGVLSAASSYIAAPAAVRLALPEASPGIYLTSSLAITFPFNLIIGIPLYSVIAEAIAGGMGL
jgi:Predicted permease